MPEQCPTCGKPLMIQEVYVEAPGGLNKRETMCANCGTTIRME